MARATADDVALAAGVSKWTVIRAFTPGASIADASREKVLRAAERLGYRPNLLARSLATKTTNQIAVMIDDFANPHKLPTLERLTLALQKEGKVLMLLNINKRYEQVDALIHADQRQVDAIILFGNSLQDDILNEARAGKINMPIFVLGRESAIDTIPSVSTDAAASVEDIGTYLAAKGYRRPGFMSGPTTHSTVLGRNRYFQDFWRRQGVDQVPVLAAEGYDRNIAALVMRDYLAGTRPEDRIDVLMCENDALAMGALDVARAEFGLRVPQDIAVVGYDGIDLAASPMFDLTTYEQPLDDMVTVLMDMLTGRIEHKSINLKGRLIARGSA